MNIELIMEHLKILSNDELDIIKKNIDVIYRDRFSEIFLSKLSHIKKLLSDYEALGLDNYEVPDEEHSHMLSDIDQHIANLSNDLLDSNYLSTEYLSCEIRDKFIHDFVDSYERYQIIYAKQIIERFITETESYVEFDCLYYDDLLDKMRVLEYVYDNDIYSVTRDW
jgi:hypothetical protein